MLVKSLIGTKFQHCSTLTAVLRLTCRSSSSTHTTSMDLKAIFEKMNAVRKSNHPWQRGVPTPQTYHSWNTQSGSWTSKKGNEQQQQPATNKSFSVLSWNIDFMRSFTNERMAVALSFLERYVAGLSRPCVVMLNEMLVSDLELIQKQDWVRARYNLTDVSNEFWESGYYGM